MDTPLLALTRRRPDALRGRSPNDAAAENMRQLVQLRWIAVAGQLLAILVADYALGVRLPIGAMLVVVGALALVNLLFTFTLSRLWIVNGELLMALLLDMAALTALLYLSGGATNPFISLYLLQVVLGAILLAPWMVWLLIAVSCASYAFLSIAHLPLRMPPPAWRLSADLRIIGEWVSFAMVAILLVLFITRISRNLRAREAYATELAQRAAEEDGIVRMGLFASGAAHQLGTPLSSLAVLVADWQRDERLMADPQLKEELADARAEIQRCKEIVSDILDSAGQSRGEAMGSTLVEEMLEELASSWQPLHPAVGLQLTTENLGDARVAAEPALRQAIWNLLENAAEASASAINLGVEIAADQLRLAVADNGSGFRPDQLDGAGALHRSSKGPGRGVGLFLASNVARRLGGALGVTNRPDGGALVSLMLPLASIGAREGLE
jgi:two-component system sensor histidine kinase RegB